MKNSIKSFIITFIINVILATQNMALPVIAYYLLFMIINCIYMEVEQLDRLKVCKTQKTQNWVKCEFTKFTRISVVISTIIIIFVFLLDKTILNAFYLVVATVGLNSYAFLLMNKKIYEKEHDNFSLMPKRNLIGDKYTLPSWKNLDKNTRHKLWEEFHQKVPEKGETHLFIFKGFTKTIVRIISPQFGKIDYDNISSEVLDILQGYPLEKESPWKENVGNYIKD